ncbi:MAG TPA: autoinducer binding domain-containing protein [Burkholderiaceae bacterium]|nr:autoinducer binding domain-containing protein [Burkholderiaceae bacterium]
MLQSEYLDVVQSRDPGEFRDQLTRFAKRLGFDHMAAMVVVDQPQSEPQFISVENLPERYIELFQDLGDVKLDPVMQHCKRQSVPIVWSQQTYVAEGVMPKWEQQASFGLSTGIAMALHLPEGRHFVLGVMRDQALPASPGELTRLVADVQLFAVYAQDAAMRVLVAPELQPERPKLTPRELEALRWTMEGKTAWEVGTILGISERTAVLHINNAMHKLGCVNKHQAVLKALKLGLIG